MQTDLLADLHFAAPRPLSAVETALRERGLPELRRAVQALDLCVQVGHQPQLCKAWAQVAPCPLSTHLVRRAAWQWVQPSDVDLSPTSYLDLLQGLAEQQAEQAALLPAAIVMPGLSTPGSLPALTWEASPLSPSPLGAGSPAPVRTPGVQLQLASPAPRPSAQVNDLPLHRAARGALIHACHLLSSLEPQETMMCKRTGMDCSNGSACFICGMLGWGVGWGFVLQQGIAGVQHRLVRRHSSARP